MAKSPFNLRFIFRFLGILLFIECLLMLVAAGVGFLYRESDAWLFVQSAAMTVAGGLLLCLLGIKARTEIGKHESFVIVTMVWVLFSLFGSIPFCLCGSFRNFTDAFFESISGFTTTGSSILTDVESLSHAILFWRSLIQWLGGIGIILLSLAVVPLLKLNSFQLFTAEVTGPVYDKLHPRLSGTAKRMWLVYAGLTLAETLLLAAGPMDWFDALCHSFTTMGTGGFSTRNASIGYWNSTYIDTVIGVFMFLAGTSFVMIYQLCSGHINKVRQNEEFRWYVLAVLVFGLATAVLLAATGSQRVGGALRQGFFHTVSIITTTGFATAKFSTWAPCLRFLLILLMCTGAMSGSTSGNIKIGRLVICGKTCVNEMKRDVHPNAVLPVMYNGKALPASTISSLSGFLFMYILLVLVSTGLFFALGLNMEEALGISISTLGNVGPGLGDYFASFATLPAFAKWWMAFLMLVGRLEIYTVLLLFSRDFWRKI